MKEPWFHIVSEVEADQPAITVRDVQLAVCRHFDVNLRNMVGPRRGAGSMMPRHIAMYLAREMTSKSFPTLGRSFNRDHTVVVYAAQKIAARVAANDKQVKASLSSIRRELGRAA